MGAGRAHRGRGLSLLPIALVVAGFVVISTVSCYEGPEAQSGDDAYRNQAAEIPLGQPVPDSFSWDKRDRSDWKKFVLPEDGLLTVNVHFTAEKTGARVELFDTYGKLIQKRLKEWDRDQHLKFSEELRAGRYFLRIMADDEGDESDYTVLLDFGG